MIKQTGWLLLVGMIAAQAGCGRSSLLPTRCILGVSATALDFGEVAAGGAVTRTLTVDNSGGEACRLADLALSPTSDAGFSLAPGTPSTMTLWPLQSATISVTFSPATVSVPLARSGTLRFSSNDPDHAAVSVPLTAHIKSQCAIAIAPAALDFGHVMLGDSSTLSVTVTDTGVGACELANIVIGSGSDPEFTLATGQAQTLVIQPGASARVSVTFTASEIKPPHHRTGTLELDSTDPARPHSIVPLSADIDIGCDLTITPTDLNFGNVILNTTATASVTLGNDGTSTCVVSSIALAPGTDPAFTLAAGQPTGFSVAPGQTQTIPVTFSAFDSQPPHLKTGKLTFQTGNTRMPDGVVTLEAYVNTVCVEASRWIYTLDQNGMFSRFDPATLTFTDIAVLSCPGETSSPNSMAVDQNAIAWVAYNSGRMYQVDTSTAACTSTSFVPNQDNLLVFGMGFVFDPMTGIDTLYIAGGPTIQATTSTLATVSMPGLVVSPVGTVTVGLPELSGLGDGTLWGFMPDVASATGQAMLAQLDPKSGATLQSFSYPTLHGSNWAMKFWGGAFWIFLGQSVYEVSRTTPNMVTTAIPNAGRTIVGAGVSTCAPLQ
jgi:hypothetical protein